MASYRVFIKPSAAKELARIPLKDRRRVARRIASLADDPRPAGCEKLTGEDAFRLRQGSYRIVYTIEDDILTVVVIKIGDRKNVYR
ncbi:MAG TPA: type II toxin-antitoxin system RelE/ParE family toxin [Gemmatimonadaceae bacterium]|nr:type II toxin-antitoxin system RelE/ParE family toxin [Gemmatimonadaceae bacterium]